MRVHQDAEAPSERVVEIAASSSVETQMDAMAQVAVAETNHRGGNNENIDQILHQSVVKANSINQELFDPD